jgi:hypothetical protein
MAKKSEIFFMNNYGLQNNPQVVMAGPHSNRKFRVTIKSNSTSKIIQKNLRDAINRHRDKIVTTTTKNIHALLKDIDVCDIVYKHLEEKYPLSNPALS